MSISMSLSNLSVNFSNTSARLIQTNQTSVIIELNGIDYVDYTIRVMSVLIHVLYFVSIAFLKEFQSKNIFFQHHVNFVSLLLCIHYTFFIESKFPHFDNPLVNDILCKVSEFMWMMLNFLRLYALLALAVYRFIAVHHIHLFRKIKLFGILMMIGSSWIVSMILSLLLKFSLSTTYSKWYCTDGFNEDIKITIIYYVLRTLLGTILPSCIIIVFYKKILNKVRSSIGSTLNVPRSQIQQQNNNVEQVLNIFTVQPQNSNVLLDLEIYRTPFSANQFFKFACMFRVPETHSMSITTNTVAPNTNQALKNKMTKHNNFAKQILLINIIVISASVFSVMVSLNLVLISYTEYFHLDDALLYLRYILRIIFLFIQCGIPIVSWMFYPGTFHVVQFNNWFIAKIERVFLFLLLLIGNPE
jgi:hypothetical protein